uniref:Uncharacterized protein n=1 Tax=Mucochytrium quahogii TaxID=96639 RepID=A0A7S2W1X8_9STRA|mmetsp:Transcript_790/g.1259  ORF Transcript_790/g.1259 Transcript_790/m.1259 type:complete len:247 (-) Transcript_790:68-808(-)
MSRIVPMGQAVSGETGVEANRPKGAAYENKRLQMLEQETKYANTYCVLRGEIEQLEQVLDNVSFDIGKSISKLRNSGKLSNSFKMKRVVRTELDELVAVRSKIVFKLTTKRDEAVKAKRKLVKVREKLALFVCKEIAIEQSERIKRATATRDQARKRVPNDYLRERSKQARERKNKKKQMELDRLISRMNRLTSTKNEHRAEYEAKMAKSEQQQQAKKKQEDEERRIKRATREARLLRIQHDRLKL